MERDGFEIMESDEEGSNSVRTWIYEGDDRVSVELAQDGTALFRTAIERVLTGGFLILITA